MNVGLAKEILEQLVRLDVSSFCVCPGGRSAPFVELLSHSKALSLFYFFEERSAGFFALGRSERDKKPTAVISTSGTAAAELLPSVIEASYSAVPLVLITADRPLSQSQKGSPQTLKNALGLLQDYCALSQNISKLEDLNLKEWSGRGSLHLNVCFDEPLIDEELSDPLIQSLDFSKKLKDSRGGLCPSYQNKNFLPSSLFKRSFQKGLSFKKTSPLDSFFKAAKKPLILVGELKGFEAPLVKKILRAYQNPVYLEALSNLQGADFEKIKVRGLLSGEKILSYALKSGEIDSVLRIGGIPRVRFWRDLEKNSLPVLNLSTSPHHEGLGRETFNESLYLKAENLKTKLLSLKEFGKNLKAWDQSQSQKLEQLFEKYPKSEPAWLLTIKKALKPRSKIFLGNSSPIRFWDQSLFYQRGDIEIRGQNGVNGIDGLLSRFFGQCETDQPNAACLGDLSLLYDMSGFWSAKTYPDWRVVVMNNFGGRIFSRLYSNKAFINEHSLSFEPLAKMWSINYKLFDDPAQFEWAEAHSLIEIQPSLKETESFWKEYSRLWP